jgi:hypothetical protein
MPSLAVNIAKRLDGNALLRCVREDGTETWQKLPAKLARFFPLHDLTHFAVESELRIHQGFYGLIADGWSIEDTEGKGPRGPVPPDALYVESVVGTLDSERASGTRWSASEFNEATTRYATNSGRLAPGTLTDDDLARIRKRRSELFALWEALPVGEMLILTFNGR